MTDGTAAGTRELTGISGANTYGVDPSFLTVFKSKVLFNGFDAAGNRGLWVTDGTAAGTHELTGIAGASTSGVVGGAVAAWPLTAFGKAPRIAIVYPSFPVSKMTEADGTPFLRGFLNEFRRLGHVEGLGYAAPRALLRSVLLIALSTARMCRVSTHYRQTRFAERAE